MNAAIAHYRLRIALDRLGRVGGLGLALLTGTAVFHFSALQPAREDLGVLERRLDRAARGGSAIPAPHRTGEFSQMEQFMRFFPPLDTAPQWLKTLYAIAEREKLELLEGSYRLSEDPALALAHYRISLPVRGSYPQIRRFVAGVLDEVPIASLEAVVFQREKVSDGTIEAKVTLALHMQAAPRGARPGAPARRDRLATAPAGGE